MKPIAVAILNWNGQKLLERFLPEVVAHSKELATLYVVDNASTDGSVAWVKSHFPEVKTIVLEDNFGYAGGYNKAIPALDENIIVLLNSDVQTTENWLIPIKNLFDERPNLGACQPKILDLKKPEYFEYAGAAGGFIDWLCYPFCRGRIFYNLEKDNQQYNQTGPVFWATGAAMVVRKSHYLAAGGLDETLFAHMEEIDLCWRMHLHNFDVFYCAESTVYHLGGATLHESSPRKTFLNFRNNMIMMAKNLPAREFYGKLVMRLVLDGIAAAKFLLEGKAAHSWQVFLAHMAFYKMAPKLFAYRRKHHDFKKLKSLPGTFRSTIIWHYFIKKERTFSELPKKYF